MIDVSGIVKDWELAGEWRKSPGVDWCRKDSWISVKNNVTIGEGSHIGEGVRLGPHVRLGGGCLVGANAILEGGVWCDRGVTLGEGVELGAGAYLGEDVIVPLYTELGTDHYTKAGKPICTLGLVDGYTKSLSEFEGVAYIGAGCRWFTLQEAIDHWSNHDEDRSLTLCLLESAKAIAELKGLKWS